MNNHYHFLFQLCRTNFPRWLLQEKKYFFVLINNNVYTSHMSLSLNIATKLVVEHPSRYSTFSTLFRVIFLSQTLIIRSQGCCFRPTTGTPLDKRERPKQLKLFDYQSRHAQNFLLARSFELRMSRLEREYFADDIMFSLNLLHYTVLKISQS